MIRFGRVSASYLFDNCCVAGKPLSRKNGPTAQSSGFWMRCFFKVLQVSITTSLISRRCLSAVNLLPLPCCWIAVPQQKQERQHQQQRRRRGSLSHNRIRKHRVKRHKEASKERASAANNTYHRHQHAASVKTLFVFNILSIANERSNPSSNKNNDKSNNTHGNDKGINDKSITKWGP